jgi:RNA polymerase sigma-70 factor (ECF subfamily)
MIPPGKEPEQDLLLVEQFRRGDREAFDRIVARHRREVYRIARRMTGSHEDADDVTQDTFLKAYRALGNFRGESALRTWLIRIALNLSMNLGRSRGSRTVDGVDLSLLSGPEAQSLPGSEKHLLDAERDRHVRAAVDGLPPRQRQVVILRVYEEMKFQEIAEWLGCPVGTAKANFFHAVNNLRKALS